MPSKSLLWEHFYANRSKFKGNNTHCNAWCKYCIGAHIRAMQNAEREAMSRGEHRAIRSEKEFLDDGQLHSPMYIGF